MPTKGSEIVDVEVELLRETEKAWLIRSFAGKRSREMWIPKSQGEITGPIKGVWVVTLPTWFAENKELV
jgi:hypothetical protein